MSTIENYVQAGTRANTVRAYRLALQHFEVEWGGLLPASTESVARYLAQHAEMAAISTLRLRLAAIADWHQSHGFPDPTKSRLVRKVMRGIRTLHSTLPKQARPLELAQIATVTHWLGHVIALARTHGRRTDELRHTRDRALLLIGFWRGFRSDELARLQVEHIQAIAGQGMKCFLAQSKGDREARGRTFTTPALIELCPVDAYLAWIEVANLRHGPVFRAIDRWGNVSDVGLHINSLVPLLRKLFDAAGVPFPEQYSGHSLRRGFANWATANGWDIKTLMGYVGWRDVQSAMRYVESKDPFAQMRSHVSSSPGS
ncbi:site-specific integrase [Massilia sp. NP310]|jgi:integrase|uniref:site-specific integrase n=1 Tax=Massilia sp. NP310 TaxID=2861282 RepID=UPI001C62D491|nr:site-specific integrase [Massilia sp. NP310]QYG02800.1 site-specific integrase [Massilia sp. NP310]